MTINNGGISLNKQQMIIDLFKHTQLEVANDIDV